MLARVMYKSVFGKGEGYTFLRVLAYAEDLLVALFGRNASKTEEAAAQNQLT